MMRSQPQLNLGSLMHENFFISYLFYVITLGFECDASEWKRKRGNETNAEELQQYCFTFFVLEERKCNNGEEI